MKKKRARKLSLARKTVRTLSKTHLGRAAGGDDTVVSGFSYFDGCSQACTITCNNCNSPSNFCIGTLWNCFTG